MKGTALRSAMTTVAVVGGLIAGVVEAAPASAATYGNVYVSFPTWQGNCPRSGSVYAIGGSVTGEEVPTSWQTSGWDYGDDLIYARVALNKRSRVSVQVWCSKAKPTARPRSISVSHVVIATIKPTRANQTVWVGARGVRYN